MMSMDDRSSTYAGCSITQLRLQKLSLEDGSSSDHDSKNGEDDPILQCGKFRRLQAAHEQDFLAASISNNKMQNARPGRQYWHGAEGKSIGGCVCKLNQQPSGEADWLPKRRTKEATNKDKMFSSKMKPSCSKATADSAVQQQPLLCDSVETPSRNLANHSVTSLPPKKRICMNLEVGAAPQSHNSTLSMSHGPVARMTSNQTDQTPPFMNTNSINNITGKQRYLNGDEPQKTVKFGDKTSIISRRISEKNVGSTRDVKASKLLFRRYKLLSEIV